MTSNNAFLKPTAEVADKYSPIYPADATWQDTIDHLCSDPHERRVLESLYEQSKESRVFRTPILLQEAYEDEGEKFPPYVIDGTHRLCVAILHNYPEILVLREQDDLLDLDASEAMVQTKIDLSDFTFIDQEFPFELLRSFPLGQNGWASSSIASSSNQIMEILWYIDGCRIDEELTRKISKEVHHFTAPYLKEGRSGRISTVIVEDDED